MLTVVYPTEELLVDGADQPVGTSTVIVPLAIPPAAAVYVPLTVFPVEPFARFVVGIRTEPVPSAA